MSYEEKDISSYAEEKIRQNILNDYITEFDDCKFPFGHHLIDNTIRFEENYAPFVLLIGDYSIGKTTFLSTISASISERLDKRILYCSAKRENIFKRIKFGNNTEENKADMTFSSLNLMKNMKIRHLNFQTPSFSFIIESIQKNVRDFAPDILIIEDIQAIKQDIENEKISKYVFYDSLLTAFKIFQKGLNIPTIITKNTSFDFKDYGSSSALKDIPEIPVYLFDRIVGLHSISFYGLTEDNEGYAVKDGDFTLEVLYPFKLVVKNNSTNWYTG